MQSRMSKIAADSDGPSTTVASLLEGIEKSLHRLQAIYLSSGQIPSGSMSSRTRTDPSDGMIGHAYREAYSSDDPKQGRASPAMQLFQLERYAV